MKGLVVAAMASGSGKTILTCSLLAALKARGLQLQAFKCGPDYIDPAFHREVLGVASRNLDLFLQSAKGVRATFSCAEGKDMALVEGVMGFYDGRRGTDDASTWAVADTLGLPVLLAVRPQGVSLTLAAQIRGLMEFRDPSHLKGIVLTECRPGLYEHLKPLLQRETGLTVCGYLPPMEEARLPSRHLGLLTPTDLEDLSLRISALGVQAEKSIDLDTLIAMADSEAICAAKPAEPAPDCTVAVARDEAFCFLYEDNLEKIRRAGARIVFFSPLRDVCLPQADALYLPGGYPELYARTLSENRSMRDSIRTAVQSGLPTVAECGGFLYLQESLEDPDGSSWPMVRALPGRSFRAAGLVRFGYGELEASSDSLVLRAGEAVPVHEFHHWESSQPEPVQRPNLYAGFPHLHFGGQLPLAERFVQGARQWKNHER